MKDKNDFMKLVKWVPVVIAAVVAGVQTLGEQKQQERIDDMENRITNLEKEDEA